MGADLERTWHFLSVLMNQKITIDCYERYELKDASLLVLCRAAY